MRNFEVAYSGDDESMIAASKNALLSAMQTIFQDMKRETKVPGLTWDQLDFIIEEFRKKKAEIIKQEHEL